MTKEVRGYYHVNDFIIEKFSSYSQLLMFLFRKKKEVFMVYFCYYFNDVYFIDNAGGGLVM